MKASYQINIGFIIQKIQDTTTVFDPDTSTLSTLNETGSYIFEEIKKGNSIEKIAEHLSKTYNISYATALKDTKKIIESLKQKNIIKEKH